MNQHPDTILEKAGGLATITLNQPDRANALSVAMRESLDGALRDVAADESIAVVLLQAAGPTFCGGLDLAGLPDQPAQWRQRVLAAQANHMAIVRMPKVVIAAVQGAAVGGGAALALSCDILMLADNAQLSFPYVKLGIVPDGGSSYFLQAKLGVALGLDLLLTGGALDAAEALRLGLTRRVVPAGELHARALDLADEMLRQPPEARMLTKALCHQFWGARLDSLLAHEADAFAFATTTPGHRAAVSRVSRRRQQP